MEYVDKFNSKERFSDRVDNYVKYRPTYPVELIDFLQQKGALTSGAVIADVGAGTGILTELLLKRGFKVYAVEPNAKMREAAEEKLGDYPDFTSVNGTGEATGLADQSVQMITVAQAFHWMDPEKTKQEFERILVPGGHMAILWNLRILDSVFDRGYEEVKATFGKDYYEIRKAHEPELIAFMKPAELEKYYFRHQQELDFEGLKGQLLSSSYMPQPGQERYEEMMKALVELFEVNQRDGVVTVTYDTKLYINK